MIWLILVAVVVLVLLALVVVRRPPRSGHLESATVLKAKYKQEGRGYGPTGS